jgi:pimeloyl-ACP methyl ester carboxylesterase
VNPKRRLVILITGFLKPHAFGGLVELALALQQLMLPGVEVRLYRWHEHDRIVKETREYDPDEIIIVGHSYGVSTGMFVAWTLSEYTIKHFVSTDGVWRPDIHKPSFKSLKKWHHLLVPTNIEKLWTFRQSKGRITGHSFAGEKINEQWIFDETPKGYRHAVMDRLPELFTLVKNLVRYDSPTPTKTTPD